MHLRCPLCGNDSYTNSKYSGFYCYPRLGGCGMSSSIFISNYKSLLSFQIGNDEYLDKQIDVYAHDLYIPYMSRYSRENTRLILDLKGSNNCNINNVKSRASDIIQNDLDLIITNLEKYKKNRPTIMAMARSKPDTFWKDYELQFRPTISIALEKSSVKLENSDEIWMMDGVQFLKRVKETQTTHRARSQNIVNNGPAPYRGITQDTCILNGDINGKYIILIDDIYTPGVYVDEDCIQFLYDKGARDVILYVLGVTITPPKDSDKDKLGITD